MFGHLHKRVEESMSVLFSDISYALLRAKLLAEMVIAVIASSELLQQVVAEPERMDIAESFISRVSIRGDHMARRISENQDGLAERDARLVAEVAKES